jgi:RimJ/RimL family protein N-acetyltransferase
MRANTRPLLDLTLATPRVVLRYPDDDELAVLAEIAAAGIHLPGERPYLTPWTEGTPQQTADHVVRQHHSRREEWAPDAWALELGVFVGRQAVGMVALRGRAFRTARQVQTESWLGLNFQRQGLGTEARAALLHLAFAELGASTALTEVFLDNAGSQGVSRRLGYRHDGVSRDLRDGEMVLSDRLRLERHEWLARERLQVDVEGVQQCLPLFGL